MILISILPSTIGVNADSGAIGCVAFVGTQCVTDADNTIATASAVAVVADSIVGVRHVCVC